MKQTIEEAIMESLTKVPYWNITVETGYVPKTTFWTDFSIAERYGAVEVLDTFDRAFKEWKSNIEYLAELSLVLNHKIWYWHEKNNEYLAKAYNKLWQEIEDYAYGEGNLTEEEQSYYFRTTD